MKPVNIKRSYVVYPPNYKPGDGFRKADTIKKAVRIATAYGHGSIVNRDKRVTKKVGCSTWISSDYQFTLERFAKRY